MLHLHGGHRGRPASRAAKARRHALRAQRHEPGAGQVPGARRHDRGAPRLRGDRRPHRAVRRRDRAHPGRRSRSPASRSPCSTSWSIWPATHYVTGDERMRAAIERIEKELQERLAAFERGGEAPRGPATPDAHAVRPRDDAGGRVLQRHRELLRTARRARPRRGPEHAARLLPRRLPDGDRREPPGRAPAPRPVPGRPGPQGAAHRARVPAPRARRTTVRSSSRRSSSASTRWCSCPRRPVRSSSRSRRRSPSRSSAPPGWSIPR